MDKCEECKYWKEFENKNGECYRYAPFPSRFCTRDPKDDGHKNDPVLSGTRWPMTKSDQWCGEFSEKE